MTVKPNDFFFGLVEFLAFIVPGMLLFATLPKIVYAEVPDYLTIIGNDQISSFGWVCFVLLSYIYGHFIHHISALLLNPVYNKTVFARKKKKHLHFIEDAEKSIAKELPEHTDILRIADAYLRSKQPSLVSELEKYEANSKLFRSLCLLCVYLCFYPNLEMAGKITLIVLSLLCFSKFANQRWTHRLVVYEYFMILHKR
ncbi:hypothetical protein [Flavobacterium sp.]|uniref:hypothetical protein n=1 Tax=Flavobacterium sp. TaxID=239 RepID=UPI0039E3720F